MGNITIKVVFDRKKEADTKKKKGLIQIRVTKNRKQVFISTGIKVFKNQWDAGKECVKNSLQSESYNTIINTYIQKINDYRSECVKSNTIFDFTYMKNILQKDNKGNFLDFVEKRIKERGDIRNTTRKAHLSAYKILKEFGRIINFSDITFANVQMFDDYLHKKGLKQTTIWGRHRFLKSYINEAIKFGEIGKNPYITFKVNRGKSEEGRYITEGEMQKIIHCTLPKSLEKVRDLMIVEFYTGLSVSDLMNFDFSKIETINGKSAILDTRKKTEELYYIMLFKPVLFVLEKYDFKLPKMSVQQYNMRMKIVAEYAMINKPSIASHWLRRGYGMMLINKGIPIEVVSKSLGHTSIRTTETAYAKILGSTVLNVLADLDI